MARLFAQAELEAIIKILATPHLHPLRWWDETALVRIYVQRCFPHCGGARLHPCVSFS